MFPDMTAKPPADWNGDITTLTAAIADCREYLDDMLATTLRYESNREDAPTRKNAVTKPVTTNDNGWRQLLNVPWSDLARNKPGQTMSQSVPSPTGLIGEQSTARALNTVKAERLFVIHSIPVRSNCDIDHVVICSRGIFIMDSKNVTNGYRVDGDSTEYLGHDGWTAFDVQKDLMKHKDLVRQRLRDRGYGAVASARGLITPAVVMWGGQAEKSTPDADDPAVEFVNGAMLVSWIIDGVRHPAIISDSLANALYNDMRRSTFWL